MTPYETDRPADSIITENPMCGLEGLQPYPGAAPESEADGTADMKALFVDKASRAPYVERSYPESWSDVFAGEGAKLEDWTLGANRNGYRGMADEPLPVRTPVDSDWNED